MQWENRYSPRSSAHQENSFYAEQVLSPRSIIRFFLSHPEYRCPLFSNQHTLKLVWWHNAFIVLIISSETYELHQRRLSRLIYLLSKVVKFDNVFPVFYSDYKVLVVDWSIKFLRPEIRIVRFLKCRVSRLALLANTNLHFINSHKLFLLEYHLVDYFISLRLFEMQVDIWYNQISLPIISNQGCTLHKKCDSIPIFDANYFYKWHTLIQFWTFHKRNWFG